MKNMENIEFGNFDEFSNSLVELYRCDDNGIITDLLIIYDSNFICFDYKIFIRKQNEEYFIELDIRCIYGGNNNFLSINPYDETSKYSTIYKIKEDILYISGRKESSQSTLIFMKLVSKSNNISDINTQPLLKYMLLSKCIKLPDNKIRHCLKYTNNNKTSYVVLYYSMLKECSIRDFVFCVITDGNIQNYDVCSDTYNENNSGTRFEVGDCRYYGNKLQFFCPSDKETLRSAIFDNIILSETTDNEKSDILKIIKGNNIIK